MSELLVPRKRSLGVYPPGPVPGPPPIPPPERWSQNSYMVTFAFRCNIACTFCMVEDVLDVFPGTSYERFASFVASRPAALNGVRRIIFSGGEVTMSKELPRYVELARSIPGVDQVRLQTNATRLGDAKYLRSLLDVGVTEFFVSIHGHDEATCDAITQRRGSFGQIVRGMESIVAAGATLITNTAIVEANFEGLPSIVDLVAPIGPRSMEFWNYWPRADEQGKRQHFARVTDVQAPLLAALGKCVAHNIPPVVKWFPRCLLGPYAAYQDDSQPPALIEENYWERAPAYACIYDGVCLDSGAKPCAGLAHVYVERYGWEQETLTPRRAPQASSDEPALGAGLLLARSLLSGVGSTPSLPEDDKVIGARLAPLGLAPGGPDASIGGWRILAARAGGKDATDRVLTLSFGRGTLAVEVRLSPHDPERRCYGRSRSFNVSYSRASADAEAEVHTLMQALLAHLARVDQGGLDWS